jgi:hypothetical protein
MFTHISSCCGSRMVGERCCSLPSIECSSPREGALGERIAEAHTRANRRTQGREERRHTGPIGIGERGRTGADHFARGSTLIVGRPAIEAHRARHTADVSTTLESADSSMHSSLFAPSFNAALCPPSASTDDRTLLSTDGRARHRRPDAGDERREVAAVGVHLAQRGCDIEWQLIEVHRGRVRLRHHREEGAVAARGAAAHRRRSARAAVEGEIDASEAADAFDESNRTAADCVCSLVGCVRRPRLHSSRGRLRILPLRRRSAAVHLYVR